MVTLHYKLQLLVALYSFALLYYSALGASTCKAKYVTEQVCQRSYGTELERTTVSSAVACSQRCAVLTLCRSFMFESDAWRCRINAKEATGLTTSCARKVTYGRLQKATCRAEWLYEACSRNTDCPVPNSYCRDSSCKCHIGYPYKHRSDSCVASCPGGYGSRYSSHPGLLSGFNDRIVTVNSAAQCRAICTAETSFTCRSIDFVPDTVFDCFLSVDTAVTQPDAYDGPQSPFVTYLRNCA